MAYTVNYLVKTANRCVVHVYGDGQAGSVSFGLTAAAFGFDRGLSGIGLTSACLSKVVHGSKGVGGTGGISIGFSGSSLGNPVYLPYGTSNTLYFERFGIKNGAPSANGSGHVIGDEAKYFSLILEYVVGSENPT